MPAIGVLPFSVHYTLFTIEKNFFKLEKPYISLLIRNLTMIK